MLPIPTAVVAIPVTTGVAVAANAHHKKIGFALYAIRPGHRSFEQISKKGWWREKEEKNSFKLLVLL